MARTAIIVKAARSRVNPKFSSRVLRRCWRCARGRGFMRDFELCRICFRELANRGELPGIKKASW
ncbi:MAG: type Z 30S ribosomal protein S14 [bacterium]|nr:type Z 30S ribosomal protein S14 [bacterium]